MGNIRRSPTHCRGCHRPYTEVTRFHYPSGREGCWECREAAKKASYERCRANNNAARRAKRANDPEYRERVNAGRRAKRRVNRPRVVDSTRSFYEATIPAVALYREEAAKRGLRVA